MGLRSKLSALFSVIAWLILTVQTIFLFGSAPELTVDYLSIAISGIICLFFYAMPSHNKDFLAPPRVMAVLIFLFYPVYSLVYLEFPELGKWYFEYFSAADFSRKLAITNYMTVLALVLFQVGYSAGTIREIASTYRPLTHSNASTPFGVNLIILSVGMGFGGMFAYAESIGGIQQVVQQMSSIASRRIWRESSSPFYYFGMLLLTAPPLLATLTIYHKKSALKVFAAVLIMSLSSALLMFTQASREKAILPLILFVLSLMILSRNENMQRLRSLRRMLILMIGGLLVAAFTVQATFRVGEGKTLDPLHFMSDFNRIDVSIVMFTDYFQGSSGTELLLGAPFFGYPSKIFGIEAIPNTSEVLQNFIFSGNPNAGNPGAPMAGELYLNFGLFAYLAFPLFGYLFGQAYIRLVRSEYEFWRVQFYSVWLYFFMFKFLIYTGPSESELVLALVLIPLAMWKLLLRVRT